MRMDSSRTSEQLANRVTRGELAMLARAVRGDTYTNGLATVLPQLQMRHRRELRTEPHWSKEELVRHPEPRELIRSMRKAGNLDDQGRPMYTLDERRSLTADIYENRVVRQVVDTLRQRLEILDRSTDVSVASEAGELLRELAEARRQAGFLDDVGAAGRTAMPTATLTRDPLYRCVMGVRMELAEDAGAS
jgi:hypothetical protein